MNPEAVLDGNWIGSSTKPSARLYPHQWSWDSAFIAIGNAARGRTDRAVAELETLFAAQWSDGMIPHMVFDLAAKDYHPSPEVWGTAAIDRMPAGTVSSGMIQPAVHALAVRRVADALPAEQRRAFLERNVPHLEAWHDFLHRHRKVDGLLEIHHPWESGMDNSPLWDDALAAVDLEQLPVPEYRRVDTDHAPADERPTEDHYDRYMAILGVLRADEYRPRDRSILPFRIADVLTNSVAAAADLELAAIQQELGMPSETSSTRALELVAAMEQQLWNDDLGLFVNVDRCSGQPTLVRCASGLLPLSLPLSPSTQNALTQTADRMAADGPHGWVMPTVAVDDPAFDPRCYWRGPVWVNVTWLLIEAFSARRPAHALGPRLRSGILELVARSGCNEYFDPLTGDPLGADRFSWSAALVIDLEARTPLS